MDNPTTPKQKKPVVTFADSNYLIQHQLYAAG